MKRNSIKTLNILYLVLILAIDVCCDRHNLYDFKIGPDFVCIERPDDPTGYLQLICNYIKDNFEFYAMDLNKLEIVSIISGADYKYCRSYCSENYDFVKLNCCLSGDWAVIDKIHLKVVELLLGYYYPYSAPSRFAARATTASPSTTGARLSISTIWLSHPECAICQRRPCCSASTDRNEFLKVRRERFL